MTTDQQIKVDEYAEGDVLIAEGHVTTEQFYEAYKRYLVETVGEAPDVDYALTLEDIEGLADHAKAVWYDEDDGGWDLSDAARASADAKPITIVRLD